MVSDNIKVEFGINKCVKPTPREGRKYPHMESSYQTTISCRNWNQKLLPLALYRRRWWNWTPQDEIQAPEREQEKDQTNTEVWTQCKNQDCCHQFIGSPRCHLQLWCYRPETRWDPMPGHVNQEQLCMYRMHPMKVDVDRMYLPYQDVRRGLMSLEKEYNAIIVRIQKCITQIADINIQALLKHQRSKALHSVHKETEK